MQFLSNPTTQFIVTSILTLLGVIITAIVTIVIFRKQSRKEIAYAVISNSPVISIDAGLQGKAQVMYNGMAINDARLVVLRIWNSGNLPIAASDYDVPVKLSFGEKTEVLDFEVLETNPDNLQVLVKQDGQSLILEPVLLNSQDSFKIKILLTKFDNILNINARIVGIKQFVRAESAYIGSYLRAFFSRPLSPTTFRMLITFIGAALFAMMFNAPHSFNLHEYVIALLAFIIATLITLALFWKLKNLFPQNVRLLLIIVVFLTFLTFVPFYLMVQLLLEHPTPPF